MMIPTRYLHTGMRGLGVDEMQLANPRSPCAPGLHLVDGSCFRSIGPGGNPVAGPQENNNIARTLLGGGATCNREMIGVGPYAYEQNICRASDGSVIAGADAIAETAFVQASLRNPGNPQVIPAAGQQQPVLYGARPNRVPPPAPVSRPVVHGGSAVQSPTQAPVLPPEHAVTKKPQKGVEEKEEKGEDGNFLLILGAIAAGVFFLLRGEQ